MLFDRPAEPPAQASAESNDTDEPGGETSADADDRKVESGLFSNMYPKRSPFRFFSFTRQG